MTSWAIRIAAAALAIGCSNGFEVENIGALAQPIFMPDFYGSSGLGGLKCGNPFQNWECKVPDNKHIKMRFQASTCSPWLGARVVEAWNDLAYDIQWMGGEWQLSVGDNYLIRCDSGVGALGGFFPRDYDIHNTSRGTLKQYRKGDILISPLELEDCGSHTLEECARRARNTVRHEFGHLIGLGHFEGCGPELMRQCPDGSVWYDEHIATNEELWGAICYNEDSGPNDDC